MNSALATLYNYMRYQVANAELDTLTSQKCIMQAN